MRTTAAAARSATGAGFGQVLRAEWTKLRSLRSTLAIVASLALALPLLAVLVAVTASLQPDDTILGASVLGGGALALVLAACLGATIVTSEYRSGTIRTTLAACPRRLVVLAAKAVLAAAVVAVVALPAAAAAFGLGTALLDGDRYARGEPFPALAGVALVLAALAMLGVGVGTIVRHPAGAVAAVVAVVLLPGLLAPLLGGWQRWLGGAAPTGVLQKLVQSSDATHEAVGSLGAWPSLTLVVAAATAVALGAAWVLCRRDS